MIVLGIADSFTSGAAIISDGKVIAAVNEERLDRNKMCMGFPNLSVTEVLLLANVLPTEIDSVAVATESLFWRPYCLPYSDPYRENKGGSMRHNFLTLGASLSTFFGGSDLSKNTYYKLKKLLTYSRKSNIRRTLRDKFKINASVTFLDHHLCHAASAYFTSGFENATVITADGAGDNKSATAYKVTKGNFELLQGIYSYDSVGNYYAYITHLCGYKAHKHEGKITGLAAMGKPRFLNLLEKYITNNKGIIQNIGRCFDHKAILKLQTDLSGNFSPSDLSASIQDLLEKIVSHFSDYWVKKSRISDVALAGGVFANVKLNQRIHELESTRKVFIHPGMGDDGLAVGAALYEDNRLSGFRIQPIIKDVYFGGDFTNSQIEKSLLKHKLKPMELEDRLEVVVAKLLSEGKVVARFDGRMEYGPRALGNRTILYQPTDPSVNEWLNKRLIRTEFMPFAPVTLWEDRHNYYLNVNGAEETARFMTITFDCTESMKKNCPAVVHVDETARPQLIREEDNPSYYQIVKEYEKITGLSTVINTSFNMHEEPIVCTPEDAIRSFKVGHLDYLSIGNFLIKNNSQLNHKLIPYPK